MKKIVALVAGVAAGVAVFAAVAAPAPAQAQTNAELQAQIQTLLAQIQSLQAQASGSGSVSVSYSFTRDLAMGSQGADVAALQDLLIAQNKGQAAATLATTLSTGVAKGYFGAQTRAALAEWQMQNGVSPAVGYFGAITRAKIASMGTPVTGGDIDEDDEDEDEDNDGPLDGGAGSLKDVDYVSKLSNEEVGEGSEDVEVAGLEIEADENSDIELVAVNLNFSAGTAGSDFDKYAEEVSVWLDGEELARVDADEFEDDDNFDQTISLDRGGIIRSGETGSLVVQVSGLANLDSDDETDTWTLEFESVRFRDGSGAVVTDSDTGDINDGAGRTFSFEGFAAASNLEFKVSSGDDEVNDTQTISVDASDDTDNVDVLSFEVEVEGDSAVDIDDLSVDFTSVSAGVGEIINTAKIIVDGDIIGSETVSSTTATTRTITFDNLDWQIEAGDTVEVLVQVDVNDTDGGFANGATLTTDVNPDDAAWDVEDEEGNDVGATDKTGAATSDAHVFYSEGVRLEMVDQSATTDDSTGDAAGGETGVYTVEFTVTAFEDDMYLPTGATISTSSVDTDDAVSYMVEDGDGSGQMLNAAGLASTTAAVSSTADQSGAYYVVREGESETFTLTVNLTPTADGYFHVQLYGVNYNVGAAAAADTMQTATPTSEFETDNVRIDV